MFVHDPTILVSGIPVCLRDPRLQPHLASCLGPRCMRVRLDKEASVEITFGRGKLLRPARRSKWDTGPPSNRVSFFGQDLRNSPKGHGFKSFQHLKALECSGCEKGSYEHQWHGAGAVMGGGAPAGKGKPMKGLVMASVVAP